MKFYRFIPKDKVYSKAKSLIRKAKREILATMDLGEEASTPLPAPYHRLIEEKFRTGVLVRRLGFGSKKAFRKLSLVYPKNKNFKFTYGGSIKNYQRMIVVDRSRALCKIGGQFVYTDFKPFVLSLAEFFEMLYNRGR